MPAWVARCGLEARAPRRVQGPSQTPTQASRTSFNDPTLGAWSCRAANSGATNSRVLIMQVDDEDVGEERCLPPGSAGILPAWVVRCGLETRAPRRVQGPSQTPLRRPERPLTTRRLAHGHAAPRTPARRTAVSSSCRLMTRTLVKSDAFLLGAQASCLHGSPVAGWKPALPGGCRVLTNTHSGVQNVL